jgi:hypothetical protein
MLAVVLGCLFVSATPGAAADPMISSTGDVTYVPAIQASFNQQTLGFTVDAPDADVHVTVDAEVGGGPVDFGQLASACTQSGNGVNDCLVTQSAQPQTLSLNFSEADLNSLVLTSRSATVTVTATIAGGGPAATGHIQVRPQSDLTVTGLHVTGLSQSAFALAFNAVNHGPSGSASTKIVITGFRTQPPGTLPAGCVWSARLTITCTRQGQPNLDDSGAMQLPVLPAQTGCTYRVVVTGLYPDPHGSNNTATARGPGPCLASATTPTVTPSAPTSPPASPSTPASTTGSPGSGQPSGAASGPSTVLAGDSSSSGSTLGKALIALSGILVLAGLIVAYIGFRRPPGGWPDEPSTQPRR